MAKKRDVAENIKDTAGSAFETMHNALEATENMAMNAVDATKKAVNNLTDDEQNK
ncbi:hypothetical protein ACFYKX_04900 [Cytobacillus sp. FJAT-54145]|uniref:Uncharacterized protein n=1 Tax=Cytobacillus spartinae TaxID=3299023 RepID=A0ABW6K6Y0_9BACI